MQVECNVTIWNTDCSVVQTNNNNNNNNNKFDETLNHIKTVCPILAKEQFIKRYDRLCAQLHFNIC